jgi:hypothetical protein
MLSGETLVPLSEAVGWIQERTGRRPHLATLHRWATRGVRGVVLETVAVGHLRYTSTAALERFMTAKPAEAAPISLPTAPPPAPRPRVNRRESTAALRARVFRVTTDGAG